VALWLFLQLGRGYGGEIIEAGARRGNTRLQCISLMRVGVGEEVGGPNSDHHPREENAKRGDYSTRAKTGWLSVFFQEVRAHSGKAGCAEGGDGMGFRETVRCKN